MKIKNILLYLPNGFVSTLAKHYRTNLDDSIKDKIIEEGMYHFVPNEEVANAIVESEYLKPAEGWDKYINSYGTPVACMFAGLPSLENYAKNCATISSETNPYSNPCKIYTAVKISPENKEQLKNYKTRNLSDNAVLYEGYCVLPHERVTVEKLVLDLVRDENGNPIKDDKGEYQIDFRQVRKEELIDGSNLYLAQKDYLDCIRQRAIELGYSKNNDTVVHKFNNTVNGFGDLSRMEFEITKKTIKENFKGNLIKLYEDLKKFINNIRNPKLEEPVDVVINEFKFGIKNPYQDKKFGTFVSDIQSKENLVQLKLTDVLKNLNNSKEGQYLSNKYKEVENNIAGTRIHGKQHSNRVIINSMIIAQGQEMFKEGKDENNRIKDILITAAAYHDIGRIGNNGPHSARSARKIRKMDLKFSDGTPYSEEDKKILMAVVQAHEGTPDKIEKMISKYNIQDTNDRIIARELSTVLRDADALDRVRLDSVSLTNTKTNLKPEYLVTNTAKQLLEEAYELENLTKKVGSMDKILKFAKLDSENNKLQKATDEYLSELKVDYSSINHDIANKKAEEAKLENKKTIDLHNFDDFTND